MYGTRLADAFNSYVVPQQHYQQLPMEPGQFMSAPLPSQLRLQPLLQSPSAYAAPEQQPQATYAQPQPQMQLQPQPQWSSATAEPASHRRSSRDRDKDRDKDRGDASAYLATLPVLATVPSPPPAPLQLPQMPYYQAPIEGSSTSYIRVPKLVAWAVVAVVLLAVIIALIVMVAKTQETVTRLSSQNDVMLQMLMHVVGNATRKFP